MKLPDIAFGVIIIVVFVVQRTLADDIDDIRHFECLKQSEISPDVYDDMMDKLIADETDDMDQRFKCYTHCMLEKGGRLNENGKLDLTKFEDYHMSERDMEAMEKCKSDNDDIADSCEYSFALTVCYMQAIIANHEGTEEINE
ncbi:general odorant-binding protein 57c-like [Musca vetustissima]|uniref:general odorant-binding protein 57c-like n=1 Tax=Musca vetustissima TaxID=27455 RepID=UPI002AB6DEB6|nr:general odorant-binding protein 57c-like [Musca vetustissima]